MMSKVFVIIPAYNEEQTVREVVQDVQKYCSKVIVVDDGSSDNTSSQANDLPVVLLRHLVNRGQGAALQTGMTYALSQGADVIVTFDADGQHNASDIERLVEPIQDGKAEVVLGSRFLSSKFKVQSSKLQFKVQNCQSIIPWTRWIILKLALLHQWFFTSLKVSDTHCGLRAFSRSAAQKIRITQDRMSHASEILDQIARHKLKFVEVPVRVKYTDYSLKKGQKSFIGALRIIYDFLIGKILNSNFKPTTQN